MHIPNIMVHNNQAFLGHKDRKITIYLKITLFRHNNGKNNIN